VHAGHFESALEKLMMTPPLLFIDSGMQCLKFESTWKR